MSSTTGRGATVDTSDGGFDARLQRARAGDPGAWSELYHQLAPLVIGYLRAQRLPDPEDVAGEVMLELVRGIDRFQGDASGFRSWVLTIAHHRLLDARRRASRRPVTTLANDAHRTPPASDDPEAETLAQLGFGELEPALATLTEEQRTVLLLRVIGDLPIVEVARITGRRQGAVRQLQRRAAAAMRRALDQPGPGELVPARAPAPTGRSAVMSVRRAGRDILEPRDASPA